MTLTTTPMINNTISKSGKSLDYDISLLEDSKPRLIQKTSMLFILMLLTISTLRVLLYVVECFSFNVCFALTCAFFV